MFHKVNSVSPMKNYKLCIHFWDGVTKMYDTKPLFDKWPIFNELRGELFYEVKVDEGGYGVSWNENIDLSCDELWENGEIIKTKFDGLIAFSDASEMWGLNESTLRKAVAYGKFANGVDVCKFGKQWLVSVAAMEREYGAKRVSIKSPR